MLALESAKALIKVELLYLQGKLSWHGSPILIGNPVIIADEHKSLKAIVEAFCNSFLLVITSFANFGSFAIDLRNGALIYELSTRNPSSFGVVVALFVRSLYRFVYTFHPFSSYTLHMATTPS